jgi:hypothetical protein
MRSLRARGTGSASRRPRRHCCARACRSIGEAVARSASRSDRRRGLRLLGTGCDRRNRDLLALWEEPAKAERWSRHPEKGRGIYRVRWRQFGGNLGPRLSFRRGPTMHVRPGAVPAGGVVRVFGSAGGCGPGNDVILLSEAFPRRNEFAGVPAVLTPVRADGRYRTRIRIPRRRRAGSYQVGARCGGANFGIARALEVLAPGT